MRVAQSRHKGYRYVEEQISLGLSGHFVSLRGCALRPFDCRVSK
jgi:hypothetical protein